MQKGGEDVKKVAFVSDEALVGKVARRFKRLLKSNPGANRWEMIKEAVRYCYKQIGKIATLEECHLFASKIAQWKPRRPQRHTETIGQWLERNNENRYLIPDEMRDLGLDPGIVQ